MEISRLQSGYTWSEDQVVKVISKPLELAQFNILMVLIKFRNRLAMEQYERECLQYFQTHVCLEDFYHER